MCCCGFVLLIAFVPDNRRNQFLVENTRISPFLLSLHDLLDCPVVRYVPGTDNQRFQSVNQSLDELITSNSFNQPNLVRSEFSKHFCSLLCLNAIFSMKDISREDWRKSVPCITWLQKEETSATSYSPGFLLLQVCRLRQVDLDCPTKHHNDQFKMRPNTPIFAIILNLQFSFLWTELNV